MKCDNPTDKINYKNLFKLGTKTYEKEVDKVFDKIERWFDKKIKDTPLRYLTVPKEMREVGEFINAYRAETVDIARQANKLADFLRDELTDEDSIALTRALAGDDTAPAHLQKLYDRFRKVIDQNAKKLVDNGALAEENVIKDYLKRYYKEYLEKKGKFSTTFSKLYKRKDLTHEQRLELGLIEQADFVIANTILEQNIQLKKAKLLKRIADEFAVDDPFVVEKSKKKLEEDMRLLISQIKKIKRTIDSKKNEISQYISNQKKKREEKLNRLREQLLKVQESLENLKIEKQKIEKKIDDFIKDNSIDSLDKDKFAKEMTSELNEKTKKLNKKISSIKSRIKKIQENEKNKISEFKDLEVLKEKVKQQKDREHKLKELENQQKKLEQAIKKENEKLDISKNTLEQKGYKRVSDETIGGGIYKYGALAGKYVPESVYIQLNQAQLVKNALSYLEKNYLTQFIDHIKVNVTVKNPGTHLYNVMSNLSVAYLNGDLGALAKVTKMMIFDRKKFKKLVDLARKFGLNNEIEDYEHATVGINPKKDKNILVKVLKNFYFAEGTIAGKSIRKVYGMEDEIFKLASFYRRIEGKKMSTKTAQHHFKEAMADYVDYSTPLPPLVKVLDKNGVFPFTHYIWKSTPRVAKIIAKNPIKYVLLQIALLESGASLLGKDDNYEKPDWANDKGFAGYFKFLPSNLFGAKQWVKLHDDEYLNIGRALPGMRMGGLAFDGGFVGSFLSIMQGKDPLWGSKLYKESDNTLQALFKSLQKFSENYAPPLTYGRYGQRLAKKATGFHPKKNDYKEEMGYDEILYQMLGVRKFNSSKHLLEHYKATLKAYANGKMSQDELDKKLRAILIYAEEHNIDMDMGKADKSYRRYTKDEPKGFWDRWFL